jgi:hypothetical protein
MAPDSSCGQAHNAARHSRVAVSIHMSKLLKFFLIISAICFLNCVGLKSVDKIEPVSQEQLNDSIISIARILQGDWTNINKSKRADGKLKLPEIEKLSIGNWVEMGTEKLINKLEIQGVSGEWTGDKKLSMTTYEIEAKIEYKNHVYGLTICSDSIQNFLGLTKINNSIFILDNGQKFSRTK